MSPKGQTYRKDKTALKQRSPQPKSQNFETSAQHLLPAIIIQRAKLDPGSLTSGEILHLRTVIGNRTVGRLLAQETRKYETSNSLGPVGTSLTNVAQRQAPSVGADVSASQGVTINIGLPKVSKKLSYITISNPRVSVTAKPTQKTETELRKPGTEATGDIEVGGGKATVKNEPKTGKAAGGTGGGHAKLKAALKKKYGNAFFTDAEGEVGTSGGSISLNAGGEWKNASMSVKFTLLSMGDQGKDIKITTATPSASAKGIVTVDGVNFECKATISVDVKPNSIAIAKWLIKKGIIQSMRGFGKLAGKIGAIPFLFIEAGYETLEAAYKNIKASKEIPAFIDSSNKLALEAGNGFVRGVLGGYGALGSKSGRAWFLKAYEVAKTDNPKMTEEEFRQALLASQEWQENAKSQIAYQVKGAIYRGFVTKKADDWSPSGMKMVRIGLFGSAGKAPTGEAGLGVALPKIVKLKEPGLVEFPAEEAKAKEVPPAIRGEVKHRIRTYQYTGQIPHLGINYEFKYSKQTKEAQVFGGDQSSVFYYAPP